MTADVYTNSFLKTRVIQRQDICRSVCRQMLFWFGSAWLFCYQVCWVVFFGITISWETFFLQVVQNILDTERAHVSELQVSQLKIFIVFRWLCKDALLALGSLHSFKLMSTFFVREMILSIVCQLFNMLRPQFQIQKTFNFVS